MAATFASRESRGLDPTVRPCAETIFLAMAADGRIGDERAEKLSGIAVRGIGAAELDF